MMRLPLKFRMIRLAISLPIIKSHAVENLRIAAGDEAGEFHGMVFQDSDIYKWLEEAAYALSYHPDPQLRELCDKTVDLIARAQQSDGYLDTPYQIKTGEWAHRERSH